MIKYDLRFGGLSFKGKIPLHKRKNVLYIGYIGITISIYIGFLVNFLSFSC